jgi:hypothetical protein
MGQGVTSSPPFVDLDWWIGLGWLGHVGIAHGDAEFHSE